MIVTVHEAKSQLSKLIRAVENGEEVIIARRDKPVARLVKEEAGRGNRELGWGAGLMSEEALEYLTNNPALDREIEKDFEDAAAAQKPYRSDGDDGK